MKVNFSGCDKPKPTVGQLKVGQMAIVEIDSEQHLLLVIFGNQAVSLTNPSYTWGAGNYHKLPLVRYIEVGEQIILEAE